MRISVVVPNYNGIGILINCLGSLQNHDRKPDQIVVVDNGSSDGSPDIIRRDFPFVDLLPLETNTGFTGANNEGIKVADGELVVLLNNDCIVEPGWLSSLERRMEDPSVAAVTSSMRNIEDINLMDSAGGEIDWMGFSRDIGKGQTASTFGNSMDLPFPSGGAVMIRRKALPDPTRIFWNELFAYQEDLDLGYELLRTGWKIVYEPTAVVRHIHSATAGRGSFFKEYFCIRNRLLVMRKHFKDETISALIPLIRQWQNYWAAASFVRGRITLVKAILRGTAEGLEMDVPAFKGEVSLNRVFLNHAKRFYPVNHIKKKLYAQAEKAIRNEISGEQPF